MVRSRPRVLPCLSHGGGGALGQSRHDSLAIQAETTSRGEGRRSHEARAGFDTFEMRYPKYPTSNQQQFVPSNAQDKVNNADSVFIFLII